MFVISHRNRNICSSLYGIANGGKTRRRKREDKRRGRRREEKVYVYAEQRSITHTDDKKVIRQDM